VPTHPALLMPLLLGKCKLTHAPFSALHRAAGLLRKLDQQSPYSQTATLPAPGFLFPL
jgi:hypothetical protein